MLFLSLNFRKIDIELQIKKFKSLIKINIAFIIILYLNQALLFNLFTLNLNKKKIIFFKNKKLFYFD